MVLFEDDDVLIVADERQSDVLIITFACMDFYRGSNSYWGSELIQKLGVSGLGVVAKRNNWYPRRSTLTALAAAKSVLRRHRRRVTYGFSMGGYAALKFGSAVRAATSVAVSAQISISPAF